MGWNTLISVSSSTVLKVLEGKAVTDICRFHRTMVSMVFIVIVLIRQLLDGRMRLGWVMY